MIKLQEESAIAGVSELRQSVKKVIEEARINPVIVTSRNHPVAVLLNYEEYQRIGSLVEILEDSVLGHLAHQRASRKGRKTITLEEAEQRVGLARNVQSHH